MILDAGSVTDAVECTNLIERKGRFELFVYLDSKRPLFMLRCEETHDVVAFGELDEKSLKAFLAARKALWGKSSA